ncbi:MAG: ABC transporter ATP-binding protein/permease [Solobacterium sp.]|nr:ABC transporter ATP-binding protein/permease [Solobacterium sp.]
MLKTLMKQIGQYKKAAILTPVFMIGEVLMEVLIPYITANLIDEGIEAANMAAVWKYGLIMLVMAFVSLMCGAMSGKYAAYASTGFAANLRRSMYEKIQTYSFANIDKFSTAGLVTRMTTDVTNLQNAFQMIIRMAVRPPMMLILSVIMCITISPSLSTIFLVAVIVLAIALSILIVNTTKIFRQTFEKYDALNASVQENVSAARVVKAFVREDYETDKFKKAAGNLRAMFVKAEALIALNNPVMMMIVYGCIISLSWFGAKQVVSGVLTTGQLTSMFSYIMSILMSLMMLSMVFVMITMSTASAARISEVLNEVPDIANPAEPIMDVENGQIDFNDVSFAYNTEGSGENVLQDIDLHIRSGETIGIIGGTGSGKSTLVSLISRLYDATEGSVAVGGVNVKDYDQEALRNKVAVVLQKNVLFSGTILDNLRWGKEDATEEECIKACRLACADEFIEKFPDKYNSWVEQGGNNLSGGQKQRLCIARALLKDPKILILDDSTSAVDTATDAKIRDAFANTIPDTTKLIIAQRISSVQHADRIIVLNDGKVDGFDSHENLLQSNEIYRDIYETQLKGSGDFDEPGREGGN